MGSMYQQGMPYGGLINSGGQMVRPPAGGPPQQYNGARPMGFGTPPSPGRGLLYVNGQPPRPPGPGSQFAPATRTMSNSSQPPPPAPPAVSRSASQPAGYPPRPPFSPSPAETFPRLRDEESDPFPALVPQRSAPPPGPVLYTAAAAARGVVRPKEQDFSMLQDDFPALPGTKANKSPESLEGSVPTRLTEDDMLESGEGDFDVRPGEDDPAEGYGLLGLLGVIRLTVPDRNTLALGTDLTTLGLNLASPDILYNTFLSPWAEASRKDTPALPPSLAAPPKFALAPAVQRLPSLPDETLLLIFYAMPGDALQQHAAFHLYGREWRFHKEHKVWVTRAAGAEAQATPTGERGLFVYFDPSTWKRVTKEMTLQFDMLEERRQPPPL